ncbi:MAG: Ig domain-containing protein, partial [Verrucomicrobiales bacterium]|nr:Ig domain-containing protein [Verrucomicrobiales bacterium]
MDNAGGNSSDNWRETIRGLFPLVVNGATNWNTIVPADLDAVLATNDWVNVQDGYNYRQQPQVDYFFDTIPADHGALWRSNVTRLAQEMVAGNARNAASGHTAVWELGNEIYADIAGQTVSTWAFTRGLPYPHPASPFNDNPTHTNRMNDRGIIGYQVEYQMALAIEALNAVNATSAAPHKIKILSPASTISTINSGWQNALLSYRIVGYEIETNAGGVFTNFAKPLASSLAGQVMSNLVDIVNVHYILGPNATLLNTVISNWVAPGARIQAVWHTEEGGIVSANSGRGGVSAMNGFSRAMDTWLARGLSPTNARLIFYGASDGPAGTRGDDALDLLHAFMPANSTTLTRRPGLLSSGALTLESYTFESDDGTKRALFVLPTANATVNISNVTMLAGGWNWTNVTGVARLWQTGIVPASNNVAMTRAGDGSSYTLEFPTATFTNLNSQALVIFLTGSGTNTNPPVPPAITTASPVAPCVVGFPYAVSLVATGGVAPYAWSVTAGSLPAGLSLNSKGVLSGTPTATSTFNFTVQATDATNATATKALAITS